MCGHHRLGLRPDFLAVLSSPEVRQLKLNKMRIDQRQAGQMRPVKVTTEYLMTAEGSALIEVGNTRVLCAASVE